jgi:hypothetical protein
MSAVIQKEAAAKYPTITSSGVDHKAWAKRFVYRAERGDRDLLHVQVQFAYMALDMPVPKGDEK